eukprot:CAMPEP_0170471804 /NCGR_PEP_ID=MMETSP0123-20130129/13965_1 /TAXON_ID=182087 /ORGANISM="Favella ehrenbergii, Strain Fehren 1" /LENGTH=92 /DNA_ID=CAMNT_0010739701 /DNA_START=409 /DNA_END=684 /DNA_ORIENTATION=-
MAGKKWEDQHDPVLDLENQPPAQHRRLRFEKLQTKEQLPTKMKVLRDMGRRGTIQSTPSKNDTERPRSSKNADESPFGFMCGRVIFQLFKNR